METFPLDRPEIQIIPPSDTPRAPTGLIEWFINVPSERTHVGSSFAGRDTDLNALRDCLFENYICGLCGPAAWCR